MADEQPAMSSTSKTTGHFRLTDYLLGGMLMVTVAMGGWIADGILTRIEKLEDRAIKNADRLLKIEANRFTSADAVTLVASIGEIKTQLAAFPRDVPPPWFVSRVERIETRQDQVILALGELRAAVASGLVRADGKHE